MKLLKPAENRTAFAKIGIMGEAGSGKTFTASMLARGLAAQSKSKQIAFFDTEKGSDFEVSRMKKEGFELLVHKGRAFSDLVSIIKEAQEAKIPCLIIDSITHVWRELCDSYQKKYNKKFLTMYDWGTLKTQWKEYTDLFVNSQIHIMMCGRLGFTYDQGVNEDTGKKELIKTGTRMKVEGETGYEPDLLLEMEAVNINDKIVNRAWVIKDRSDTMNGKSIDYPSFSSFKTFFAALNIGGEHHGVDTERTSEGRFADPDWSAAEVQKKKEILLDELKACLIKADMDGTSSESKKKRVTLLEKHFGTSSGTAIENLHPKQLAPIIEEIKKELFPHKPLEGAPQVS